MLHFDGQYIVSAALTLVVPGLNVPWWHLPLFILALVIAGIMHELGHALAAVDANVPVSGFGIFIFAIYPGAFTEIDSDALSKHCSFFVHSFTFSYLLKPLNLLLKGLFLS